MSLNFFNEEFSVDDVDMYKWATELFPINRSLTGHGNRQTLSYIKNLLPNLEIKYFKSNEKVFDWEIPNEWHVYEAYIEDESYNKIVDFKINNLHLMGYSISVDSWLTLKELETHLFSIPELPEAIPYKTSYYKKDWGFCISHNQRMSLKNEKYHVVIKSELFKGQLDYGELLIKGRSKKEVIFSTYRFIFIPETIGSIAYISKNLKHLKKYTLSGFVVTCVGDDLSYSFLGSRLGNTYADKISKYTLDSFLDKVNIYSFLKRGSDERQFCSPLVDLPFVSIMRSKYGTFKEYHTSLDNLNFIKKNALYDSLKIYLKIISVIENNFIITPLIFCEPQLGKRNLYKISSNDDADNLINFLAYIDGKLDLVEISEKINTDFISCLKIFEIIKNQNNLIKYKLI
jgi:aminopeptidase-like protein